MAEEMTKADAQMARKMVQQMFPTVYISGPHRVGRGPHWTITIDSDRLYSLEAVGRKIDHIQKWGTLAEQAEQALERAREQAGL